MISRTIACSGALALAFVLAGCQHQPRIADAPPPPPPPPPSVTSPVVVQAPGPWGVFFDLDKVELKPQARPILDLVVAAYRTYGRSLVTINGHGDTTGSSPYNLQLGQRRAEVVKAYLMDNGVSSDRIVTMTDGEQDLLVPTPDDVKERRNRRVEITFGPM